MNEACSACGTTIKRKDNTATCSECGKEAHIGCGYADNYTVDGKAVFVCDKCLSEGTPQAEVAA